MIQRLHVRRGNVQELLGALLYRRVASGFEAVLALAERGMHTEGLAQRRSMLEALFVLGAIWKRPDLAAKYLLDDEYRRLKIFKNIKQLPLAIQQSLAPELSIESIDEKIAALKKATAGSTPTTIADYAKAAALFGYYLTDYSFASEAAHHVAKDLERQIVLDREGDVDAFYWGPEVEVPSKLLSNAVEFMLMAVAATADLFGVTAPQELETLRKRTDEMLELHAGAANAG